MPHTHDVEISGNVVRKTFVSWDQGEPDREWAALEHLGRHAPDLAPAPLARTVVDDRPVVEMSRVAGSSLTRHLTTAQTRGLADAVRRLFAVPVPEDLPVRANDPVGFTGRFRSWLDEDYDWAQCQDSVLVREGVSAAQEWLDQNPAPERWIVDPVIALGDGNLDNVLWDGETCRLIDWEEFGASDLAYEVADVVEHASSRLEGRLDVPEFLSVLDLDESRRGRVEHHRPFFASFWLAMLLPGNGGWHRNPPGSTESQARHLLGAVSR